MYAIIVCKGRERERGRANRKGKMRESRSFREWGSGAQTKNHIQKTGHQCFSKKPPPPTPPKSSRETLQKRIPDNS